MRKKIWWRLILGWLIILGQMTRKPLILPDAQTEAPAFWGALTGWAFMWVLGIWLAYTGHRGKRPAVSGANRAASTALPESGRQDAGSRPGSR